MWNLPLASRHSITSSALASSVGGIVNSSAHALKRMSIPDKVFRYTPSYGYYSTNTVSNSARVARN
jgi:hypothetical protein